MSELTLASLYDTVHSLERVLEAFPVLIVATDHAGRIVMTSRRTRDALDLAEVDLLDRPVAAVVPGLELAVSLPEDGGGPRVEIGATRRRALRRDATAFPVEVQATAHRFGDDVICIVALLDVTERVQATRDLRESRDLLDTVLAGLPAMVAAKTPDGTYEFMNAYQATVFGIAADDAVGRCAADLLGSAAGEPMDRADRRLADGTAITQIGEEDLIDADGRTRRFMMTRAAMRDANDRVQRVLTVGFDITHAAAAEERIARTALLDDMTGLPNRVALRQILGAQLRTAERDNRRMTVMLIRFSNLSEIAQDLGENARDGIVRRLAIRLGGLVAESAVLSRWGEATFALVGTAAETFEALKHDAAKLVARASRTVATADGPVAVQCRAGVALYPDCGQDADSLLHAAEQALRTRRRGPIIAAQPIGDFKARRQAARDLRRDIQEDRLRLRLIPIYSTGGETPDGAAVERRLPDVDAVSGFRACLFDSGDRPLLCVPAGDVGEHAPLTAAAAGLAADLCERVLRDACRIAAAWRRPSHVSVPFAAESLLQPDVVDTVGDALRQSGLSAGRLRLAIDESALTVDPERIGGTLNALARLGVGLCLNGFGGGGNPMLQLGRQPFQAVVIDASRIGALDDGVAAVVAFAGRLRRIVGADGIHSSNALAFLRRCGCTEVSGPLFGPPLDPRNVDALNGPGPGGRDASPLPRVLAEAGADAGGGS